MVVLTNPHWAELMDEVLNSFDFALPIANLGTFKAVVQFEPGPRSNNRDPTEAAFVRSIGVFTPRPSQAVALRPAPPRVYKVTLKLNSGLSSLLAIYGAFLGRHIAMDQQKTAILTGMTNLFMISQEYNLLNRDFAELRWTLARRPFAQMVVGSHGHFRNRNKRVLLLKVFSLS